MAKLSNLMLVSLVIFAGIQAATSVYVHNRTKRAGKCPSCQGNPLCPPKYEVFSGHTACFKPSSRARVIPLSNAEKQAIVDYHNKLRSEAQPPPSNMLKMSWDTELEMLARRWADSCDRNYANNKFQHDAVRSIPGRFLVGQNIGNGYNDFTAVTDAWYAEYNDYNPQFGTQLTQLDPNKEVGHYTQIVWAATSLIGCAASYCGTNFMVCDYGPGGNIMPFSSPYLASGGLGSMCKTKTSLGLCDCGGLVCENFGELDVSTCTCTCMYPQYKGNCQLNCSSERYFGCGRPRFTVDDCKYPYMVSACPQVCGICPCADPKYKVVPCAGDDAGSRIPTWTAGLFFAHLPDELNYVIFLCIVRWFTEKC